MSKTKIEQEKISALSDHESNKLETAFKIADRGEEFAKLFCQVAKDYTSIKDLFIEMMRGLLESDKDARKSLKKIIREVEKEDIWIWGKKIGFAAWTILILFVGAIINSHIK